MEDSEINIAPVDRLTSAHLGTGAVLARLGVPWWAALAFTVGWELAENPLKRRYPQLFPFSSEDSWMNSLTDSLAMLAGYAATNYAMADGLGRRGEAALDSLVGSTLGGAIASTGYGVLAGEEKPVDRAHFRVRQGGEILGAVAGAVLGGHGLPAAGASAVGAAVFGPTGSAVGGYLTTGILSAEPNPEHGYEEEAYQAEPDPYGVYQEQF